MFLGQNFGKKGQFSQTIQVNLGQKQKRITPEKYPLSLRVIGGGFTPTNILLQYLETSIKSKVLTAQLVIIIFVCIQPDSYHFSSNSLQKVVH